MVSNIDLSEIRDYGITLRLPFYWQNNFAVMSSQKNKMRFCLQGPNLILIRHFLLKQLFGIIDCYVP